MGSVAAVSSLQAVVRILHGGQLSASNHREFGQGIIHPKIDQSQKGQYALHRSSTVHDVSVKGGIYNIQLALSALIPSWFPTITNALYTSFLIRHTTMVAIQFKLLALVALCTLAASTAIERVSAYITRASRH